MKVIYSNAKTQKPCEDFKKATKALGNEVAVKLHDLINAIKDFPRLYDLYVMPQYRLHALAANRKGQYSFVIHKGYKWRLIVYPLDEEGRLLSDRSNERELLEKSVMVEIVEVSEHYD